MISVFVVLAVLFISLSLAIAAETFTDKYAGKAQYERDVTLRGHTEVEMTLFKKESDTYVGEVIRGKINKKGKSKGNKYIAIRAKMIDGNLVGYSKSGTEFMTLTMKNGILFGTYHLARVYKGEIELRKIDQTEREVPNDVKEKLSSSASSEDEDDEE